MNTQFLKCLLAIAILICAHVNSWAINRETTTSIAAFQEDVILQWNRVLTETVLTPGQHPPTIMPVVPFERRQ